MPRKLLAIFLAGALLSASSSVNSCGKDQPLDIGGIRPGASKTDISRIMGDPIRVTVGKGFIQSFMYYRGTIIGLDEDGLVAYAHVTASAPCFRQVICVGGKAAKLNALGLARLQRERYVIYGDSCWVEFATNRSRVSSITLKCSP